VIFFVKVVLARAWAILVRTLYGPGLPPPWSRSWEQKLHQYPLVIQLFDLLVTHVQQRLEDVLGIRAQAGCGTMNIAWGLRHFEWDAWIELFAHDGMIDTLHEAARLHMLILDKLARAQDRAC